MPRGYSHGAILLSGALASSKYQSPQSKGCQGRPSEPPQHIGIPRCFSVSPLAEIRPEAHLASTNLRGEAGKVFVVVTVLLCGHAI